MIDYLIRLIVTLFFVYEWWVVRSQDYQARHPDSERPNIVNTLARQTVRGKRNQRERKGAKVFIIGFMSFWGCLPLIRKASWDTDPFIEMILVITVWLAGVLLFEVFLLLANREQKNQSEK